MVQVVLGLRLRKVVVVLGALIVRCRLFAPHLMCTMYLSAAPPVLGGCQVMVTRRGFAVSVSSVTGPGGLMVVSVIVTVTGWMVMLL